MSTKPTRVSLLFFAPALLVVGVFFIYPVLSSFYYSLTDWNGLSQVFHFVGVRNFFQFGDTPLFSSGLRNTLVFATAVTIIQNACAVFLATTLDGPSRFKTFSRAAFFAPAVFSALIVGYSWSFILNPLFGVLNTFLYAVGLGVLALDWFGDPTLALGSLVFINCWQFIGYSAAIYLADLQGIPHDLYEAASIDGASRKKVFFGITLPMLAPSITINVLLAMIGSMKLFDLVYATTKGGPGYATETMATIIYKEAFQNNQFGMGTAEAVVLFLVILILSMAQLKFLRSREVDA